MHPRHKNRRPPRGIEVAWLDSLQSGRFAGTDWAQAFQRYALRLFNHTLVPNDQRGFVRCHQRVQVLLGSVPEEAFDQGASPFGRTQQVAQALGTGWGLVSIQDVCSRLAEQQPIFGVAQHQYGLKSEEKNSNQTLVYLGIKPL